jgi:hypothetical protein
MSSRSRHSSTLDEWNWQVVYRDLAIFLRLFLFFSVVAVVSWHQPVGHSAGLIQQTTQRLRGADKGRSDEKDIRALSESLNALRSRFNSEDQALLDQLTDARAQIARLVLDGPQKFTAKQYQARIKTLEDQAEKLEADISRRSREFRAQSLPVGEALRQVQLEMLKGKRRQHPYYWASFIQSGEWANLEGKR